MYLQEITNPSCTKFLHLLFFKFSFFFFTSTLSQITMWGWIYCNKKNKVKIKLQNAKEEKCKMTTHYIEVVGGGGSRGAIVTQSLLKVMSHKICFRNVVFHLQCGCITLGVEICDYELKASDFLSVRSSLSRAGYPFGQVQLSCVWVITALRARGK